MKKQIIYLAVVVALVIGGIFFYTQIFTQRQIQEPEVLVDGSIKGVYSIKNILSLGRPYICSFEKFDELSKVVGLVRTDGSKIFGEFKIETELAEVPFSSFLIVKDGMTYTWTTLATMGYKAPVDSPSGGTVISTEDEIFYECKIWQEVDLKYFDLPEEIVFDEIVGT